MGNVLSGNALPHLEAQNASETVGFSQLVCPARPQHVCSVLARTCSSHEKTRGDNRKRNRQRTVENGFARGGVKRNPRPPAKRSADYGLYKAPHARRRARREFWIGN